jgi:hypothetical protein
VLDNPSQSSPAFAAEAIKCAQSATTSQKGDGDEARMREEANVAAAMIAMRDGDPELRAAHAEWARSIFASTLQVKEDPVHRFRPGLRFNPVAIAFVGMIHVAKDHGRAGEVRAILEVTARGDPAAAHGLGAAAQVLASIDERLPRAVLRCAFTSCIQRRRSWDAEEGERLADEELWRERIRSAVDFEMAWLSGSGPEPEWPTFPEEQPRRRRRFRLPSGPADEPKPAPKRSAEYTDHQAAALWLINAKSLGDVAKNPWLRDVVRIYGPWTMAANGAGLNRSEEISDPPREWNDAYFDRLARCVAGLSLPEVERLALEPLVSLPDKSFFDAVAEFVRSVDTVYFDDQDLAQPVAVGIRAKLAERMMESSGWKWMVSRPSASIETHIGQAIAVIFFNQFGFGPSTKCYLLPKGIDRIGPFLPVLEMLVQSGPSLFVALVTINLLEVSPRAEHLPFLVTAAKTWVDNYPNDSQFWVDYGIGRRVCNWIESVRVQDATLLGADDPLRLEVDRILAALVRLGVPEARRLEQALSIVTLKGSEPE